MAPMCARKESGGWNSARRIHPHGVLTCRGYCMMMMSLRRFLARPSGVSLEAIGLSEP
jgi:hypothetical protein